MPAVWLTLLTLFMITLGFAGFLGALIHHMRDAIRLRLAGLTVLVAVLVLLFPLSLPDLFSWLLWLMAFAVVILFALRPAVLPDQLHTRQFALRYASVAMLLSAVWNILAGPSLPAYLLTVSALLAALLAWLESYQSANGAKE